jgi:xylulokinase
MSLFIGVDSGTQSTKVIVLDFETKQVLGEARASYDLIEGLPPGHLEQHPKDWIAALETALSAVLEQVDRSLVRGIGVSGQQHGFVPLDTDGDVIRPAKLWCDTSTVEECEILNSALGGEKEAIQKLGNRILPGFTAPKILWLKKHEPENFAKLRHILLPHDYLNFYLTGHYFMEYGDASGTALMDVRSRQWSKEIINLIDPAIADYLPEIKSSQEPVGTLQQSVAQKFGLSPDVIVSAGGGDNMMGAIGTGNVSKGVVTASFGTSGTIYAFNEEAVIDPDGEIAAFCDSTCGFLPLLCTMNVTTVTEHTRELFELNLEELNCLIEEVPAGSGGLMMLPYFEGERTPSVPDGSGVLLGMSRQTMTQGHLARAAMEGVTLGMNYGLIRLKTLGVEPTEVRLTGGGAKSAVWRQIISDVFGLPVVAMKEDEGAALGGALQAVWCEKSLNGEEIGIREIAEGVVAVDESTRCVPDMERHAFYQKWQSLQKDLSIAMREVFKKHRKLVT